MQTASEQQVEAGRRGLVSTNLYIDPQWRALLDQAGLGSFEEILRSQAGERLGYHEGRTEVRRVTLGEREVFIKRAQITEYGEIVRDLLHLRRPLPTTYKEYLAMQIVAALGIATLQVLACGYRHVLGFPMQAVMISASLTGTPMHEWLPKQKDAGLRLAVIGAAAAAIARLLQARLCWPDAYLRHFYVQDDGSVTLLDLERLQVRPLRWRRHVRKCIQRFTGDLAKFGAAQDEIDHVVALLPKYTC